MQNLLDLKNCLSIFDHVLSKGEKVDGGYMFDGLKAWHDFDGYQCYLYYDKVTLTMMFHGKYDVDYPDKAHLDAFEKKLSRFNIKLR